MVAHLTIQSRGGIVLSGVVVNGGTVDAIVSSSGDGTIFNDTTIGMLIVSGGKVSNRKSTNPKCDSGRVVLTKGSTLDIPIPAGTGTFAGLLAVSSYFTDDFNQNTTALYLLNPNGTSPITTVSTNSGTTPRQVTVSISGNNVRLTNSTGVDCVVSATFLGNSI